MIAQALWTDRFGNVQLNVGPDDIPSGFADIVEVRCSAPTDPTGGTTRVARRVTSFAEVANGAVGLVVDSNGMLALVMDQRSAADELGIADGDQVVITPLDDDGTSGTTVKVDLTDQLAFGSHAPSHHHRPRHPPRCDPDRRDPVARPTLTSAVSEHQDGKIKMNLASIIDHHDADSVALIHRGRPTTFGQLRDQVDRMRGGLASLGVGDGDRVALLCSNSDHFVIAYYAALGLGAVAVPLNPLSPAPELEPEIANVGASVVVIEKLSAADVGERRPFRRSRRSRPSSTATRPRRPTERCSSTICWPPNPSTESTSTPITCRR